MFDNMWIRLVRNDLRQTRLVSAVLTGLVALACVLGATSAQIAVDLTRSISALFAAANLPDIVQMHAGPADADALNRFVDDTSGLADHQLVEMITVPGRALAIDGALQRDSVMEVSLVSQNAEFDRLLDSANTPIEPRDDVVYVPHFYAGSGVEVGDDVVITGDAGDLVLPVEGFLRDAMMNPAVVSSKRFLVSEATYARAAALLPDREYLVELVLDDGADAAAVAQAYREAGMPDVGPQIDRTAMAVLNGVSGGVIIILILLVAVVLIAIAWLCVRLAVLSAIAGDLREIGALRAVGIPPKRIGRMYLSRYVVLAGVGGLAGLLLSWPLTGLLTRDLRAAIGTAPEDLLGVSVPLVVTAVLVGATLAFTTIVLRRAVRVTPKEALAAGQQGGTTRTLPLSRVAAIPPAPALAVVDVAVRPRRYLLVTGIMGLATFVTVVPVLVHSTISDSSFTTYLGVGQTDLRVDMRTGADQPDRREQLEATLEAHPDVVDHTTLLAVPRDLRNADGRWQEVTIETGDHTRFPVSYLDGVPATGGREIALSYLLAGDFEVGVGDTVPMQDGDGAEVSMVVSGVYQDVTNGGRTAKAAFDPGVAPDARWAVAAIDLREGSDASAARNGLAEAVAPARVQELGAYLDETMGSTVRRLAGAAGVAAAAAAAVAMLITALYLRLQFATDRDQIALLRAVGLNARTIRRQYVIRIGLVSLIGAVVGVIAAVTIGPKLFGVAGSLVGATRIDFVANPFVAYIACPMLVLATAAGTAAITGRRVHHIAPTELGV